jgi:hypothetical protein
MLTATTILAMLMYLAVEPVEGDGNENLDLLNGRLDDLGLSLDQFTTESNGFCIGYSRGLNNGTIADEQATVNEAGEPDAVFAAAIEEGFAFALEARDIKTPPASSLVYAAWKNGDIEPGAFATWAATQDQSDGVRLAVAVTAGSGKNAVTIPAGTPVEQLAETEIDGVKNFVVLYDGAALLVPAPEDAPSPLISADNAVAPVKKARKGSKGGTRKAPADRGPTLKDAFIFVAEGLDGGPGPLATNGQIAARVRAKCRDLGIPDKASTFIAKADQHVPYYLNCYKPIKNKDTGEVTGPGRHKVMSPRVATIAKIEGRRYWLRANGSEEERMAAIPEELRDLFDDAEAVIEVPEPVEVAKVVVAKAD